ncbi:DUF1127 domain-containing protein [Profundibacterium mesophilum]|uniref:Conserved small protein n=1 Tax=Profundibacterium mesophilum KAUST100406-0324 TaxID=1037889 RepID=A0A921NTR7_9RHOB|nr:DUF1127 domain-containing protein [Profundibacterium mesophilum]KAF0675393.1 putative conserved small protein [Profundibacterium mesophilum KAUST100406-0324]
MSLTTAPRAPFLRTLSLRTPSLTVLLGLLSQSASVARQRRQLAALPADRLADLGLNRAQARHEARRPFWDLPL